MSIPVVLLRSSPLCESFATTSLDAPKRKAPAASSRVSQSHYGLYLDSSLSVTLVTLSRLLAVREPSMLEVAVATSEGAALLAALRAATLRVATTVGGATVVRPGPGFPVQRDR